MLYINLKKRQNMIANETTLLKRCACILCLYMTSGDVHTLL